MFERFWIYVCLRVICPLGLHLVSLSVIYTSAGFNQTMHIYMCCSRSESFTKKVSGPRVWGWFLAEWFFCEFFWAAGLFRGFDRQVVLSPLRDGETTIKIQFPLLGGGGAKGGERKIVTKYCFSWETLRQTKFWKCKFDSRKILLSLSRLLSPHICG